MTEQKIATPVEIIHAEEPIAEIRLANGYTARFRLICAGAWNMGGVDQFGCPNVNINMSIIPMGLVPTRTESRGAAVVGGSGGGIGMGGVLIAGPGGKAN